MISFSDPEFVADYAAKPPRFVPGFHDMQRMAAIMMAENAPDKARILVLGAGGGLELKVFAEWNADWNFLGVDPSAEMLELARTTLGPLAERAKLHEGYIDDAPQGPFDAATCILTLHFIPKEERLATLVELRRRLKPGAPLIVAHHSFPQEPAEKAIWLKRFATFAISSGIPEKDGHTMIKSIDEGLPALSPQEDEALLVQAGFENVSLFYAGFTFRGWIAFNP